jgi:hypothetical protein
LIGSESVQVFLSFIYICIAVGDPVIKYIVWCTCIFLISTVRPVPENGSWVLVSTF